jgi:hypothetical protein
VASEQGLLLASELWKFCRSVGQTPRQALRDPDLPFNLTVMRGALAGRTMVMGLTLQKISDDPFGTIRIGAMQGLQFEDP